MSAAIASLYRAAAAAVRLVASAKRDFRSAWLAARKSEPSIDFLIARLNLAYAHAEAALDAVIALELPHTHEATDEARAVRQGLRYGEVLEYMAHAAALEAIAEHFDPPITTDTRPAEIPAEGMLD